jgi:hypothetical protein
LKGRVDLANHDKYSEKGRNSKYCLKVLEKVFPPTQSHHVQALNLTGLLKAQLN